ncbi:MAG: acyl-CoA thioesterase [Marinosulfonomonas sp.]|nr:acyl-CoA thioesterase [Marinosulfonomonas sp.]
MAAQITYHSIVDPSHCDFLGHMNASQYFAACSNGVFVLQASLGLTAKDMRDGRQLAFAVVHSDTDFKAELVPGDVIYLESQVIEIGTKSIVFRHTLFRAEDKKVAFVTQSKCVMLGLTTRRAELIPDDVRKKAMEWMVETHG